MKPVLLLSSFSLVSVFFFISCSKTSQHFEQSETKDFGYATKLWYTQPSVNWNEALPIGNGRMGAMIFGGVRHERISLNEETLWSGAPKDGNNPNAKKFLPLVREAALSGKYKKADSLSKYMQGPWTQSYMPMGDLLIDYPTISDSTSYTRQLNLDSAISRVSFTNSGTRHIRTSFASYPDQVIVIHHYADKKGSITFSTQLTSKLRYVVERVSDNEIILKGKCPEHVEPAYKWKLPQNIAVQYSADSNGEGMNFEVRLIALTKSGKIKADDDGIMVENADEATLIISAATSFDGYTKSPGLQGKDPSIEAGKNIKLASTKTFVGLLARHTEDHQSIFRRVYLNLGESKNKDLSTDKRLKLMASYTDPELVSMISQFGRYLLIAGSRPGGQPLNLKGIWNERLRPEYSSNWCIDHDAQMFYYGVETNNLSEMHEPFLTLIKELSENGKKTASVNYGLKGWCAHHNTDIWRPSTPVGNYGEGNPHWATWNLSAPWLCAHLYEHYLFTGDDKFLRDEAWPVMKGAAQFCLDWLIEDEHGNLISVPSVSPENTFITRKGDTAQISVNATGDISLMKELFTNCIKVSDKLNIDKRFSDSLRRALHKLKPYAIGSKGQLLEWSQEWQAVDPSHRHLTHMYPVFPGSEIYPHRNRDLSEAAKKALTLREKTNCSWGFAWKAGCWARLHEGDSAWNTWKNQLQYVDPKSKMSLNNYGLYPNLFNSDGADLIMNGNGCATAVLTEMILQSHEEEINLLPALPKVFGTGTVNGFCARGGFIVDLTWSGNSLSHSTVFSKLGNNCIIRTSSPVKISSDSGEPDVKELEKNVYLFKTEKGGRYLVKAI